MKPFLVFAFLSIGVATAQWSPKEQELIDQIKPTAEESAWQKIGWRTDLWQARKEAAKAGKPIYLWEMDGHPLGCT
ncbi:hypothetical protein NT6N_33040 [Oceaniferula spumae]|uniref:Uncharacterized protein n=1 Tax=Oceaniferula spumae TaxID=2979115 RepID=A0AAT9FQT2_9BACT